MLKEKFYRPKSIGTELFRARLNQKCIDGCCKNNGHINQTHAAREIGVSKHTVFRTESTGTNPRSATFEKMQQWISKRTGRIPQKKG